MANNIMTGYIVDENENHITGSVVRYFGIHRNTQGVLSITETRLAEDDRYSFNLIDPDWLGNSVPFIDGEQVAIIAWQHESQDKLDIDLVRFGMFFFPHDGRDTYVQDMQLLPKAKPSCNLEASGDKAGEEITFNANASDLFQWEYLGMTHYHRDSIFGHVISSVNSLTIEYDYGDGWVTTNKHTFTTAGSYTVRTRITNVFGLFSICEKVFDFNYNAPSGCITFSNNEPVIYNVIDITACIQDSGNTIVNVDHYWEGDFIASNTDLTFVYDIALNTNKTHIAKQVITWFDGFENQTVIFEKELTMGNIPPEFDLVDTLINEEQTVSTFEFTMDKLRDPDGDDTKVNTKWKIEFKTPIDMLYKTVYDPGYNKIITQDPVVFDFNVTGYYRITATAVDELGAETTKTTIINVLAQDCPGDVVVPEPEEFIRWIEWE